MAAGCPWPTGRFGIIIEGDSPFRKSKNPKKSGSPSKKEKIGKSPFEITIHRYRNPGSCMEISTSMNVGGKVLPVQVAPEYLQYAEPQAGIPRKNVLA